MLTALEKTKQNTEGGMVGSRGTELCLVALRLETLSFKSLFKAAATWLQSCPTLCDPIDGSPSGSPVPGILQARTLEWVAISFSNAWKWKVKGKSLNLVRLLATPWTAAHQAPLSMGFSRQECWSGVPFKSRDSQKSNLLWYMNFIVIQKHLKHGFIHKHVQSKASLNSKLISVQFSHSVVSDSLRPYGLQHARLPCPSPTPGACSNSCPSIWWCHPTISSCHPLFLLPSVFPSIRVFSYESVFPIRWPMYWSFSFSISPSNEYSRLISFRIDWLDLLTVQVTLKESSTPQFKSINSLTLIFL